MVRSHIGNVVCRKALCVRVASSPPSKRWIHENSAFFFYFPLPNPLLVRYDKRQSLILQKGREQPLGCANV